MKPWRRHIPLLLLLAVLAAAQFCIVYNWLRISTDGEAVFVLDDPYSYYVVARNIYQGYGFCSDPDQPFYTLDASSLVFPYLLCLAFVTGTNIVLFGKLFGLGMYLVLLGIVYYLSRRLFPRPAIAFCICLCMQFSYYLTWSIHSGMPVLLFIVLTYLAITLFLAAHAAGNRWLKVAAYALASAAVFVKSEAIVVSAVFLAAEGIILLLDGWRGTAAWRPRLFDLGVGILLVAAGYAAWGWVHYESWQHTSTPELAVFSNAGYYVRLEHPNLLQVKNLADARAYLVEFRERFWAKLSYYGISVTGEGAFFTVLLLIGLFSWRGAEDWRRPARVLFIVLLLSPLFILYVLGFEDFGQHRRYIHHLVPLFFIIGIPPLFTRRNALRILLAVVLVAGFAWERDYTGAVVFGGLMAAAAVSGRLRWRGRLVSGMARHAVTAVLVLALLALQAHRYGDIISKVNKASFDTYQLEVKVGRWLRDHTAEDARIGCFDYSAISYYSGRKIFPLQGWWDPFLLQYNIEESREPHYRYILDERLDYIVSNPDLFPWLSSRPVFTEVARFSVTPPYYIMMNPGVVYQVSHPAVGTNAN